MRSFTSLVRIPISSGPQTHFRTFRQTSQKLQCPLSSLGSWACLKVDGLTLRPWSPSGRFSRKSGLLLLSLRRHMLLLGLGMLMRYLVVYKFRYSGPCRPCHDCPDLGIWIRLSSSLKLGSRQGLPAQGTFRRRFSGLLPGVPKPNQSMEQPTVTSHPEAHVAPACDTSPFDMYVEIA